MSKVIISKRRNTCQTRNLPILLLGSISLEYRLLLPEYQAETQKGMFTDNGTLYELEF